LVFKDEFHLPKAVTADAPLTLESFVGKVVLVKTKLEKIGIVALVLRKKVLSLPPLRVYCGNEAAVPLPNHNSAAVAAYGINVDE
jgi:hypothetical protein